MRAAMPSRRQIDCGEKRDPDERQWPKANKENELDPNTQLEKLPLDGAGTNGRLGRSRQIWRPAHSTLQSPFPAHCSNPLLKLFLGSALRDGRLHQGFEASRTVRKKCVIGDKKNQNNQKNSKYESLTA